MFHNPKYSKIFEFSPIYKCDFIKGVSLTQRCVCLFRFNFIVIVVIVFVVVVVNRHSSRNGVDDEVDGGDGEDG